MLRSLILDSALGLKPDDVSPQARAARTVEIKQFEGVNFVARIGIEKGAAKNDGSGAFWDDKNNLAGVITPDKREWHPVEQPPPFDTASPASAPAVGRPAPGHSTVLQRGRAPEVFPAHQRHDLVPGERASAQQGIALRRLPRLRFRRGSFLMANAACSI